MADGEGFRDTLAAGLRVHAGAMAFGMNAADDAVFVEGQTTQVCEFTREQQSLIETAFTFAFGVQRNRDDQVGAIQRFTLLRGVHQAREAIGNVWLTLQLQNRSPQGSFIKSASPRPAEGIILAMGTPDSLSSVFANRRFSKLTALPTHGVVFSEHARCLPARGTGDAVVTRLDARAADCAGQGIDERQRGVVERTKVMDCGRQAVVHRKGRKGPRRKTLCVPSRNTLRPLR